MSGRGCSERKPTTWIGECGASASACATSSMCLPVPDEHRAAAVAGGAQERAGQPLVGRSAARRRRGARSAASRRRCSSCEKCSPLTTAKSSATNVTAGADRRRCATAPGRCGAVGVEARAREQQRGQQVGEGDERCRRLAHRGPIGGPARRGDQALSTSAVKIARETASEVERQQRSTTRPRRRAVSHAQQEREGRRALAAHVVLGAERRRSARRGFAREWPAGRCGVRMPGRHFVAGRGDAMSLVTTLPRAPGRGDAPVAAPRSSNTPARTPRPSRRSCGEPVAEVETSGAQPSRSRARLMSGRRTASGRRRAAPRRRLGAGAGQLYDGLRQLEQGELVRVADNT